MAPPLMNTDQVHEKMEYRTMRSDDRSWPIRLAYLNKCYDSCNCVLSNLASRSSLIYELFCLHKPFKSIELSGIKEQSDL